MMFVITHDGLDINDWAIKVSVNVACTRTKDLRMIA
jgi:hypothetical protein